MKIEYVEGDLLASDEFIIAHGCNAQGVMKSGIAKAIRAQYPIAYNEYRAVYEKQGDKLNLGQVIVAETANRIILNIISQEFYGRDADVVYVSYDGIANAILNINDAFLFGDLPGHNRVAFPMIGAGLANGNWEKISSIIESYSNFQPVVYYLPS
jgi:O-acetyl-ADP-ribose deacetylase (regulator of RNase III)